MHGRPPAALVMRDAAEAIAVSWLRIDRTRVSRSDPLGEGRLDDEHRRPGEVALALGVAADVAAEAVGGQPVDGRPVDDAGSRRGSAARRRRSGSPRAPRGCGPCHRRRRSAGRRAAASRRPRRRSADAPRPRRGPPAASSARSGRSAARCWRGCSHECSRQPPYGRRPHGIRPTPEALRVGVCQPPVCRSRPSRRR